MGRKHLKKLNWNGWTEKEVNHLALYLCRHVKIGTIHCRRRTAVRLYALA